MLFAVYDWNHWIQGRKCFYCSLNEQDTIKHMLNSPCPLQMLEIHSAHKRTRTKWFELQEADWNKSPPHTKTMVAEQETLPNVRSLVWKSFIGLLKEQWHQCDGPSVAVCILFDVDRNVFDTPRGKRIHHPTDAMPLSGSLRLIFHTVVINDATPNPTFSRVQCCSRAQWQSVWWNVILQSETSENYKIPKLSGIVQ